MMRRNLFWEYLGHGYGCCKRWHEGQGWWWGGRSREGRSSPSPGRSTPSWRRSAASSDAPPQIKNLLFVSENEDTLHLVVSAVAGHQATQFFSCLLVNEPHLHKIESHLSFCGESNQTFTDVVSKLPERRMLLTFAVVATWKSWITQKFEDISN